MITIGAFEAKTHLSALLDRAVSGEEIIITKYGKPIARLTGVDQLHDGRVSEVFAKLKQFRLGKTLNGLDWRELRDVGRR